MKEKFGEKRVRTKGSSPKRGKERESKQHEKGREMFRERKSENRKNSMEGA